MTDSTVPYNEEAELAVLGSILIDPACILDIQAILRSEHFYIKKHSWTYEALVNLHRKDEPIDLLTLTTELDQSQHLEAVGGALFISQLINAVPSVAHATTYALKVKETATRRRVLRFAGEVTKLAYNETIPVSELLDRISTWTLALCGGEQVNDSLQSLEQALTTVSNNLEATQADAAPVSATGYPGLDRLLGGWRRGALHTIGASTGQGKTALALNVATYAAQAGKTVLIFSLEMSAESLGERFLATASGVSLVSLTSGQLKDDDWPKIADNIGKLSEYHIWIDDTPGITIAALRNQIKRFMLRHTLDLVLVDYIQIARLGQQVEKRYLEVGLIAQALKQIAREVDVPVIAAAQLSRATHQRDDKRPQLSDLGESSGIEQHSDVVLLIHREPSGAPRQPATLIVAKNRYGPTGDVGVLWVPADISFVNIPASKGGNHD